MSVLKSGGGLRIIRPRNGYGVRKAAGGGGLLSQAAIDGLVGWWSMEEISGNTISDVHGSYDISLSLTTGFSTAIGKQNNAITRDGTAGSTGGVGSFSNDPLWGGSSQDVAMAGWLKPLSITGTDRRIYGYSDCTAFIKMDNATLSLGYKFGTYIRNLTTTVSTNTWYWIFFYYDDSAGEIGLYVNNDNLQTAAWSGLTAGTTNRAFFEHQAYCVLDEWAIWRGIVPSADDRSALYNSGSGITYKQAVGA